MLVLINISKIFEEAIRNLTLASQKKLHFNNFNNN